MEMPKLFAYLAHQTISTTSNMELTLSEFQHTEFPPGYASLTADANAIKLYPEDSPGPSSELSGPFSHGLLAERTWYVTVHDQNAAKEAPCKDM